MESLYLLIPVSVLIVFVAIAIFLLMSDSGQFDDMLGPAYRILQDNDRPDDPATVPQAPARMDTQEREPAAAAAAAAASGHANTIKTREQE
ncbi:MAG: cbb3-type cytochrome oxidase assembly protein CcoS [Pseudomonadota bacterium]